MDILYKGLSGRIIGCAFDVFREIGPGYDEPIYHNGLKVRLTKEGLTFVSKPHFKIHYRDVEIAELEPDYLVNDEIVLELKSIQSDFEPRNYTQIISYLRLVNKRLGILINFGLLKAHFKRVPFDERQLKIIEDLKEITPQMKDPREEIQRLRDGVVNVAQELRLGYHAEIYQKAMHVELEFNQFHWEEHVKVPVYYQNVFLKDYEIDYGLVNGKILFAVLAGSKEVRTYDVMRMRTYLKDMKLNVGLIAFWGKDHLYLRGVGPYH